MQCNIDNRGRMWRFILGMLLFFMGSVIFVAAVPGTGLGWRSFQGGVMLLGIFMIFEGAFGWCALRALTDKKK